MFKRLLLSMTLLTLASVVAAQTMRFEYQGTVYENDATIISPYDEDMGEYVQHMQIRNLTDEDIVVYIEQDLLETAEGVITSLCWFSCENADENGHIVSRPSPIPAQSVNAIDITFHCMFLQGETGVVHGVYTAYEEEHPENNIRINVLFGQSADVEESSIQFGNAYPNPSSSKVYFDIKGNGNDNANVSVYNLLGQEVKSQHISGHQGRVSIAVDDLQPGIYFCRFTVNGEAVKTEKVIVKR